MYKERNTIFFNFYNIAKSTGKSVEAVRIDHYRNKFDKSDLDSIVNYINKARKNKK